MKDKHVLCSLSVLTQAGMFQYVPVSYYFGNIFSVIFKEIAFHKATF